MEGGLIEVLQKEKSEVFNFEAQEEIWAGDTKSIIDVIIDHMLANSMVVESKDLRWDHLGRCEVVRRKELMVEHWKLSHLNGCRKWGTWRLK